MNLDQEISKYVTELQPLYKRFASKIQELICSILGAKHITPHSVTSREKTATSLKEKMTREGKSYEQPLQEITDLVWCIINN
jgi:ppGpp synthetase/RelA/SpoT-type nucleotidyltranferase